MSIDASRIHVSGALAGFAQGYRVELARLGYAPASVYLQIKVFADLSDWLSSHGIEAAGLKQTDLDHFLCHRRANGHTRYSSIKAVRPLLGYLQRFGIAPRQAPGAAPDPVDVMLDRFQHYLAVERALAMVTARAYVEMMRPFIKRRLSTDHRTLNLERLTAADIISFVVARCSQQSQGAAKLTVTALRSFLRFLHLDGIIEQSLAPAVPSVASRQLVGLPKGLAPDEVRRLFASCDNDTRRGCRDTAILTMLVRLGMRSGEVAKLCLGDFDWRTGEVIVRGKANSLDRLPLPPDVGRTVARYLQQGRPVSAQGRAVFVRIKAPHRHLTSSGVSTVVADAAKRAGLGKIHAHRLRHTAAMQLLRAGASLPEIGQLLRHRRALTTAIYAKVDRAALRVIARRWPGEAA